MKEANLFIIQYFTLANRKWATVCLSLNYCSGEMASPSVNKIRSKESGQIIEGSKLVRIYASGHNERFGCQCKEFEYR
jgi:hypothetical protein